MSPSYQHDLHLALTSSTHLRTYELPDGNHIFINEARFACSEELFGLASSTSISAALNTAITKCDRDVQSELLKNVILAGGNTLLSGFAFRLEKEINEHYKLPRKVNLIAPAGTSRRSFEVSF